MSKKSAPRGMNDILPEQTPLWQSLEATASDVFGSYGYREIRLPLVEYTELFERSIGEVTDIVEKEMYSFADRNGESLTLRPEGTAGCVRAAIQRNLLSVVQRLWYTGPMFRYERPQKGRQRQFHQIGVETFGVATPDIEAELIVMSAQLWQRLGIAEDVTLELNSIGSVAARADYRAALVAYLEQRQDQLDEDSQRRLHTNPLRILDSKNPDIQALLADAPVLNDYLDDESKTDFMRLQSLLEAAGVSFRLNARLVRGLDYYNKTVFEWVTDKLGAQGTICAGGRYDGLVEQFGGKSTPGAGFALGMERLVLMLEAQVCAEEGADIYVVTAGEGAQKTAFAALGALRSALPDVQIVQHLGGGSFKSQMKKADKSGAQIALIWGEDEVASGTVTLKSLRGEQGSGQQQINSNELIDRCVVMLAAQ